MNIQTFLCCKLFITHCTRIWPWFVIIIMWMLSDIITISFNLHLKRMFMVTCKVIIQQAYWIISLIIPLFTMMTDGCLVIICSLVADNRNSCVLQMMNRCLWFFTCALQEKRTQNTHTKIIRLNSAQQISMYMKRNIFGDKHQTKNNVPSYSRRCSHGSRALICYVCMCAHMSAL